MTTVIHKVTKKVAGQHLCHSFPFYFSQMNSLSPTRYVPAKSLCMLYYFKCQLLWLLSRNCYETKRQLASLGHGRTLF